MKTTMTKKGSTDAISEPRISINADDDPNKESNVNVPQQGQTGNITQEQGTSKKISINVDDHVGVEESEQRPTYVEGSPRDADT